MTNTSNRPPVNRQNPPPGEIHPLTAAAVLANFVRVEHGREGVRRFLKAISPLVPHEFLAQLADAVGESVPAPAPPPPIVAERDEKKPAGPNPEELLLLMQALGGGGSGGGLDPKLLMKLMQK